MVGLINVAPLGGGFFLGWTLGANGAANVFGTAVATRIISFRKAVVLCGLCVILGSDLQGQAGIKTLSGLTAQTISTAAVVSVSAAVTVTLMAFWRIPISTSQAVVGAIFGIGLATRNAEYSGIVKIVLCWIGTPIGSMIMACIIYKLLGWFIQHIPMSMLTRDKILWSGLLIAGMYGSYALGANNVTNSTGIFSGLIEGVSDRYLAAIGGMAIALGVLTDSKRVMVSVGSGVMPLDAFSALVAVLAMSLNVHVFAMIGAPVSTSQGIVGSIIGVGFMRGVRAINYKVLREIAIGWLLTPVFSLIFSAAGYAIFC
ncbi:MAG: inorganic phosphate transporter [Candidatus Brocadiia bacterium]|nr:MAG: inorganic phosphate transporter [Candidatus Brocadiia bacterium]